MNQETSKYQAFKLDPNKRDYDQDFWWVGHPGHDGYPMKEGTPEEKLVKRRYDIEILGGVEDKEACYEYDDWALCRLDGEYYMLRTSGCSCPSPADTWEIERGPATLADIKKHILEGKYEGYTMPVRQRQDFVDLIESAEIAERLAR